MTKDNCRIGYPKSQACILNVLRVGIVHQNIFVHSKIMSFAIGQGSVYTIKERSLFMAGGSANRGGKDFSARKLRGQNNIHV